MHASADTSVAAQPMDPLKDPDVETFLAGFFAHLGRRDFAACYAEVQRFQRKTAPPNKEQVVLYCTAILRNEERRWDQGEARLRALLSQPLHPNLALRAWNALGIAVEHLGRLDEAAEAYDRALHLAATLGDDLYWAKVAKNRAICTIRGVEAGQIGAEALAACRQDLERCIEIFRTAGEPTLEGRSWNELGASFKVAGDWSRALACYARDEAICRAQDDRHGLAASQNNMGEALNGLGRYAEAEQVLSQAVVGFAAAGDLYEQADALANLGNALAGLGRTEIAAVAYRQATHCVEAVRRGIDQPDARMGFFGAQTRIYGRRLAYCLVQERPAEAFYVAEQARARGMLEFLGDGLPQVAPLTGEEALALLPTDTGLLAWFALDSELVGFALSHDSGLQAVRLGIAPNAVFNGSFDSRGLPRSLTPDLGGQLSDPWLAPHLFERLVAPLLAHVSACRRLVLVPHGTLHWLPLHASLDRGTGHYLYEMHDLLYAPSAAIQLTQLQARRVDASRRGGLALALSGERLHHVAAEVHDVARFTHGLALNGPDATLRALMEQSPRFRWLHLAGHAHYLSHAPLQSGVDLADGRLTAEALLAQPNLGFALAWVNGCESGRARVHPGDELLGFVRGLLAAVAPSLVLALWPVNDLAARVFARLFYTELMADTEEGQRGMAALLQRACTRMRQVSWADLRHLLQEDGHTEESIAQSLALLPRWSAAPAAPFAHPYYWAAYFLVGETWRAPLSKRSQTP